MGEFGELSELCGYSAGETVVVQAEQVEFG